MKDCPEIGRSVCTSIKWCGISTEITLKLKTKGVEFLKSFNEVNDYLERGVELFLNIYHICCSITNLSIPS